MKIQLSDHFTYKKLFRFALPSIVMMVFTSIYSVVDGYFVSNYAGKNDFAAINLIMPYVIILGSIGFMIGTGGSALVSYLLGAKQEEKAQKTFSMLIYFTVLVGIILTILGLVFLRKVAILFGAEGDMIDKCVLYGRIVIAFNVTYMLQNVFQSFFVVAEKPRMGLIVTVAAGVSNMVLDYLMVGVWGMGIAGAAFATGISQTVGGVIPLIYFVLPNSSKLHLKPAALDFPAIGKSCSNGASELMSNIAASFIGILYNWQLLKYAGEDGVATYGVLMYVQFIFVAIFVGYAVGCAPIVGYHYGAENTAELKNMRKKSIKIMSVLGVIMLILGISMADLLSRLFVGYDQALMEMTAGAFRVYALSFLLAGVNIFTSSFFTALGNGLISAIVSFMRVMVFQTSCVLILPYFFGINGIWSATAIAEVLAFALSVFFLISKQKKYHY